MADAEKGVFHGFQNLTYLAHISSVRKLCTYSTPCFAPLTWRLRCGSARLFLTPVLPVSQVKSFGVYTRTYPEFLCLGFVPVAQIQTIAWPWSYVIFPRHIFVLGDFYIHRYLFRLRFFLTSSPFFSSARWKAVMQSIIISYSPNHGVIVGPTNCSLVLLQSRSCFEPSCE